MTHLPFPDNTFDLVNAHFLFPLLRADEWSVFVRECRRVTRPGGYVRLTEPEWGSTSSPALERLHELFLRGLKQIGQSLSPDGRNLGIATRLGYFLEASGCSDVTRRAYVSDYAMGAYLPSNVALRVELLTKSFHTLILSQKLATQEELDQLTRAATAELDREDFCGMMFFLTACGRKSEAENTPAH